MVEQSIEVAVIIVAYNSRSDLADCLAGRDGWVHGDVTLRVVVVDNASTDGSADFVRDRFPGVERIQSPDNLGFAGGNNLGWEHIQQHHPQVKYVALLNPDTVPEPGWLDPLIDWMQTHRNTATCQPLITLHPQTDKINTAGNRSHFLGFGFVTRCGEPVTDDLTSGPIGYSSGAAMLVRADLLKQHGLFEPRMFLYCEDTDLGWKLGQLGYPHELIPASRVAHKFEPGDSLKHYYYLERNRGWLLWVYYKWPTLLLLLPALLMMEAGQVLFALTQGRLRDKLRAWDYFLKRDNRRHLRELRRRAQVRRSVSDKTFLKDFTGRIDYPTLTGPLVRFVANPLLSAYWWVARRLIFW